MESSIKMASAIVLKYSVMSFWTRLAFFFYFPLLYMLARKKKQFEMSKRVLALQKDGTRIRQENLVRDE